MQTNSQFSIRPTQHRTKKKELDPIHIPLAPNGMRYVICTIL